MHLLGYVFGYDNVDNILEHFSVNDIPEHFDDNYVTVSDKEKKDFYDFVIKKIGKKKHEIVDKSFEDLYNEYGFLYNKNEWKKDYEKDLWYYKEEIYNSPYAIYDWYEIGGRWNNMLKTFPDEYGIREKVNIAKVKDIDFLFMIEEAKKEIIDKYDIFLSLFNITNFFDTLKEINNENIDDIINKFSEIIISKKHEKEIEEVYRGFYSEGTYFYFMMNNEENRDIFLFYNDKNNFINKAINTDKVHYNIICPYYVIDASNETAYVEIYSAEENYHNLKEFGDFFFDNFLKKIPKDTTITVVDFHI